MSDEWEEALLPGPVESVVDDSPRAQAFRRVSARRRVSGAEQLEIEMQALRAKLASDNRRDSLRGPVFVGKRQVAHYYTQCTCKWTGTRVKDPEVARREYDAHPCTLEHGDTAVDRAIANAGRGSIGHRRYEHDPTWAARTHEMLAVKAPQPVEVVAVEAAEEAAPVAVVAAPAPAGDDAEQRFSLLELK